MKKRRRRRSALAPIFLAIMLFFICIGIIALMVIKYKENMQPVYDEISLSEEVSAKAYVWLNQIDDMNISYEDLRQAIGDINLTVELTPSGKKGIKNQQIVDGAYEQCLEKAYSGLANAYWQVVASRLTESGYDKPINQNTVEKLMKDTYGLSIVDYLKACEDLSLLPSKEDAMTKYNQEVTDEKN